MSQIKQPTSDPAAGQLAAKEEVMTTLIRTKPNRRRQLVTPALLRGMGIEPAEVKPLGRDSALLVAGVKLSFAASLKRHLNKSRKRDIIGNFNCSRPDGSPIVKGCSIQVWRVNYGRALSEALTYLEIAESHK